MVFLESRCKYRKHYLGTSEPVHYLQDVIGKTWIPSNLQMPTSRVSMTKHARHTTTLQYTNQQ